MLRLVKGGRGGAGATDTLAELARAAGENDPTAVRTLLITVGPHMLRVVGKVLGANHPDVDDVFQESASAVLDALPRYRGECSVLHFVSRVAVLTAMRVRRRESSAKRKAIREDDVLVEQLPSESSAPDAVFSRRIAAEAVRGLLDSLPVEQAEALALHCVLGYTVSEIATLSGAPVETVRSRLRLAKKALRERILGDERLAAIAEVSS